MRVKRYVVDSMPDALQKIRIDLGNDAVILNTKAVKTGGFLGMFSRKQIEVIAAVDAGNVDEAKRLDEPLEEDRPRAAGYRVRTPSAEIEQAAGSAFPKTSSSTLVAERPTDAVLVELQEMKKLMSRMMNTPQLVEHLHLHPNLKKWHDRLIEQEVDSEIVFQLMQGVMEAFPDIALIEDEQVTEMIREQLLAYLNDAPQSQMDESKRIIHFVGPTGVGKTTTIAKLAAEYMLKRRKKIGFITSDTYRIAAVEQLRTYASILNIPLEVVSSINDLRKALDRLKDCDMVFMDTAGRNYRNELYVSELNNLLMQNGDSETVLVLSLTSKYSDMVAITENFKQMKLNKVIFTKLDETHAYGAIINLIHRFGLSLSYITNGQNVPEDILLAEADQVANLILGEVKHE